MIPRSPSQILPEGDVNLSCPQAGKLTPSCRPWTRLGWTEVLFGAQYRTYSDAQKIHPGQPTNEYSVRRRREILRLQPEIEVAADQYVLEYNESNDLPVVQELKPFQHEAFNRHDPNIPKLNGDWAFFAAKAAIVAGAPDTPLVPPAAFVLPPFKNPPGNNPPSGSLRYSTPRFWAEEPLFPSQQNFQGVSKLCGTPGTKQQPNYDDCRSSTTYLGMKTLNLDWFDYFPLVHHFVGPVTAAGAERARQSASPRPEKGVCAAEAPAAVASCWKGVDDTVFLETAILYPSGTSSPYSVSALRGFERPPLAEFISEFEAYKKLACMDRDNPAGLCIAPPTATVSGAPPIPNRPTPAAPDRLIEVFAPVQSSASGSVSQNAGVALANVDSSNTDKRSTRLFMDVNGDGYPDVIADGRAELTSPVGLSRSDWWNYFRTATAASTPDFQPVASDFEQRANSFSSGNGVGLSPSTFAQTYPMGSKTKTTGSPDPNVDPGFAINLESGFDLSFSELRDFNGDGLIDKIGGITLDKQLEVQLNAGGTGLRLPSNNKLSVLGEPVYLNTSHGQGFGVRLGFSFGAGSYAAGMGLSHRDGGSQAALMDFTGDGRPDIVLPMNDGKGSLKVFPNLGNGFGPSKTITLSNWLAQPPPAPANGQESGTALSETTLLDAGGLYTYRFNSIPYFKIVFTPGVKAARNQTRELLAIRDINGDGVPDVVAVSGRFLPSLDPNTVLTQVHYNPEGKYYLLTGITNPSGSKWVLKHQLFGNTGPEHGRAAWALTAVARDDGYEPTKQSVKGPLTPDGQDVLLTTYDYNFGYYNRAERQFYGFAERTSNVYGCDFASKGAGTCLDTLKDDGGLDWPKLRDAGYQPLQTIVQTFSNEDYLTQGKELSKIVSGVQSPLGLQDIAGALPPPPHLISRRFFGYSIDNLSSLIGTHGPLCRGPPCASSISWDVTRFSDRKSAPEDAVFGSGGICGTDLKQCIKTLKANLSGEGFTREQNAFWAQQSGAVRQRLITLETFGNKVPLGDISNPTDVRLESAVDPAVARLRSAVAFDHDQWGQVLSLSSIGEADSTWNPANESSAHAVVAYAQFQGLNLENTGPQTTGYPMLGLAESIQIFAGPWIDPSKATQPLRVREAQYYNDGRGNLSDICTYPGGKDFTFILGTCKLFRDNTRAALRDGYSSVEIGFAERICQYQWAT